MEKTIVNGSIVEMSVPMPPLGAMFFMNASRMTIYGFSGVMQLVTESPIR